MVRSLNIECRAGEWSDYGASDDVPYGPKLGSYLLHTPEWREAFLERLVAVGEPALLEAAARVYDLLNEPKDYHCALIAKAAGVSGGGKHAVVKTLRAFIDEWLQPPQAFPSISPGQDLGGWHGAAMQIWKVEHEREAWVVRKFAAALDGKKFHEVPSSTLSGETADPILFGLEQGLLHGQLGPRNK